MKLLLNGTLREFAALDTEPTIAVLVQALSLAADRVAVEHNGNIAPRDTWPSAKLKENDKLEVVHFVGGGCAREERHPEPTTRPRVSESTEPASQLTDQSGGG